MWSERHRPADASEMVGNEEARSQVLSWLGSWKKGTRPLLLVGPPGTGKTTLATLAARRFGYDLVGMNASDARTKSRINEVLGPVRSSAGLHGPPLMFIDEADGIHGRSDFGGADALISILKEAAVPSILAANSDDSPKMKSVSKAVQTVRFRPVPPRLLRIYLEDVLAKEGASLGPGAVIRLVIESRGDMRSMLNSAQAAAAGLEPSPRTPLSLSVEEGVKAFLRAGSRTEALEALRSVRADPREKIGALYACSTSAEPAAARRLLRVLSEADVLHGRILRTQNWRLLRYLDAVLSGMHADARGLSYVPYGISWALLNRIRWDGPKERERNARLGLELHCSRATAAVHMPYAGLEGNKE